MTEGMNYSTAIALLTDEVTGVSCSYELDHEDKPLKLYTFKCLKDMADNLAEGDLVVIPTDSRHGFTIVRVEKVDVEIPLESSIAYKWIAGKFDTAEYDNVLEQEATLIEKVKKSQKRKKREEMRAALQEQLDEEIPKLTS